MAGEERLGQRDPFHREVSHKAPFSREQRTQRAWEGKGALSYSKGRLTPQMTDILGGSMVNDA